MTKDLNDIQRSVLAVLPKGAERPRTSKEICSLLKLNQRDLRQIISDLTNLGVPIVGERDSQHGGYYIATTKDEKQRGIHIYQSQIDNEQKRLASLRKSSVDEWLVSLMVEGVDVTKIKPDFIQVIPNSSGFMVRVNSKYTNNKKQETL